MERHIHGGDIYRNVITHDFSVNLNPLGMPESVRECLSASAADWARYPDPECESLRKGLAKAWDTVPSRILCGNGAAEIIYLLVQVIKPKKALVLAPTFFEYERALWSVGCRVEYGFLAEENGFVPDMEKITDMITGDTDMVFFCNPNNPTGIPVMAGEIERLAKACHQKHAFLVLDECFCEFLEKPEQSSAIPLVERYPHLAVLRAFTKTFAMAGLRLGYGICRDEALWEKVNAARQPWSVSLPAQAAGEIALEPQSCRNYLERTRELLKKQRPLLAEGLRSLGFTVYASEVNFLLFQDCRKPGPAAGGSLYEQCRKRGILIRDCKNFVGLTDGYYRVCIRGQEENRYLLEQLEQILDKGDGQK